MDNLIATESDNEAKERELVNIASRTRSHVRIDDFQENDNLDFPDVDPSMYQNPDSEEDSEYRQFLAQTYSIEVNNTVDTNTEDTDPSYVYNDDIFSHGWKYDLSEGIELKFNSHRIEETNSLSVDSKRFANLNKLNVGCSKSLAPPKKEHPPFIANKKTDLFSDPEFARVLNQQLRQHIQLLTQTYLLTKNVSDMQSKAEEAKNHLDSYMMIFDKRTKPSNLIPAMSIVDSLASSKEMKTSIRYSWRQLPVPDSVKKIIDENPNVFIYSSLLPQATFSILPEKLKPKKSKINFTINEDKLLAYALNEFKRETAPYAFIASLLMTAKNKTQISDHIKNIKRSPGNEDNPIKLYYINGQLPEIDFDSDAKVVEMRKQDEYEQNQDHITVEKSEVDLIHQPSHEQLIETNVQEFIPDDREVITSDKLPVLTIETQNICKVAENDIEAVPKQLIFDSTNNNIYHDHDDLMNMALDDLMAASTTISKTAMISASSNENNKSVKNLRLKKSMLNLMSHNYSLSSDMGDLIVYEFLKVAEQKLSPKNYHQLLEVLSKLIPNKDSNETDVDTTVISFYQEICKFLKKINAPTELFERVVLFLDLNQARECSNAFNYLHWARFFQFIQHIELYNDGLESLEKKLARLVDALQKDDSHKIKLAIGNLINKDPFLKREFESLSLDGVPHSSLFFCDEDFDDVSEPIANFDANVAKNENNDSLNYEHFNPKVTKEELCYASQSCPCKCHSELTDGQQGQHCINCNLKFVKGRIYLVSKIKPILAEWAYVDRSGDKSSVITTTTTAPIIKPIEPSIVEWTIDEDRAILEFCRTKVEQNEETLSFDTSTFEELVYKRGNDQNSDSSIKKNAKQIAERFNQLLELYKDGNSTNIQS